MQAGAFFGALFALPISEKIGRKPSLLIAALFAGVGGILVWPSHKIYSLSAEDVYSKLLLLALSHVYTSAEPWKVSALVLRPC
jgi:MFS family permease